MNTTKTVIEVTHDRMIDSDDVVTYVRRSVQIDRRNGTAHALKVAQCIDHVTNVTPTPVVSEYRVRIAHDPEDTPGDVRVRVQALLLEQDIECVMCEHVGGGCCEYGPDRIGSAA